MKYSLDYSSGEPDLKVNKGYENKKTLTDKLVEKHADKIAQKHYQNQKNKPPLTQVAENAVKELSFTMKDGFIENNAGDTRLKNVKEAVLINEALDKNLLDHQRSDYQKLIDSNIKAETEKPLTTWNRLDKQEKAIEQNIRAKENKNRMVGKAPYENFTQSEIFTAKYAKDKAKKKLKALMTPVKRNKDVDDISKRISELQLHRNEMEETTIKLKKEFNKIMDRPVDKDLYRGLGSIDPRLKR